MSTFLIVVIVLVVFLGIVFFNAMKEGTEQGQDFVKQLNSLPDFNPEKTLAKINNGKFKGISLDPSSKKICLINDKTFVVKPFTDVIEAEVKIDGTTITKTARGSQAIGVAVGAILAGPVGATIGGLSGKKEATDQVKSVTLQVLINDIHNPIHEIKLSDHTAIETALNEAKEWDSTLKVLIFQNS